MSNQSLVLDELNFKRWVMVTCQTFCSYQSRFTRWASWTSGFLRSEATLSPLIDLQNKSMIDVKMIQPSQTSFKRDLIVTREELAQACSLSLATVSHALNKHPRVKLTTQKRVIEMATQLGYVPNSAARRLVHARFGKRHGQFDQVGFIIFSESGISTEGYIILMEGVERKLAESEASMIFLRVFKEAHWERMAGLARSGIVDGWLLVGNVTNNVVRRIRKWKQPFVILADHQVTYPVHSVNVDNTETGRLAVKHLADLGHRRIALLGYNYHRTFQYQQEMRQGFKSMVSELNLDCDAELIQCHDMAMPDLVKRVLTLKRLPTAIVFQEPGKDRDILISLKQNGFDVPQKMSLVICECDEYSSTSASATHVNLHFEKIGYTAAAILKKLSTHPHIRTRQIKVAPTLVKGVTSCSVSRPKNSIYR